MNWLRILPYLGAVLAVLALLGGVYRAGFNAAWREAEVDTLKTRIVILERDNQIAKDAQADALIHAGELEQELRTRNDQLDFIQKALKARPEGDVPRATQSDIDLLHGVK